MWNPDQYERFKRERRQPFDDLLALIEHHPHMHVADLGCGTGELTRQLHEHLDAEATLGIDNSETMLMKSDAFGHDMLRFMRGDIEAFVGDRPFDLIFSNAALQWVPEHETLLTRLTSFLSAHGQLAVQMPANDDHVSHRLAADTARGFGIEPRVANVLPVERYAELLHHIGFHRQHVRLQVYGHTLASTTEVLEWVRGTLLTDYQRKVDAATFDRFLATYTQSLLTALGDRRPYFYTYKRILMWATF